MSKTYSIAALMQKTEPVPGGGVKTSSLVVLGHRTGSYDEAVGKFAKDMLDARSAAYTGMSIAQLVVSEVPAPAEPRPCPLCAGYGVVAVGQPCICQYPLKS